MTRGLFNWKFSDVEYVLKKHGFSLKYTNASHYYYHGVSDGSLRVVCVPFHGSTILKPRTLKGIILQSGIPKEVWLKK